MAIIETNKKDFWKVKVRLLSKCDHIYSFLWIRSNLLKKFSIENFFFCAVLLAFMVCKYGTFWSRKNKTNS